MPTPLRCEVAELHRPVGTLFGLAVRFPQVETRGYLMLSLRDMQVAGESPHNPTLCAGPPRFVAPIGGPASLRSWPTLRVRSCSLRPVKNGDQVERLGNQLPGTVLNQLVARPKAPQRPHRIDVRGNRRLHIRSRVSEE